MPTVKADAEKYAYRGMSLYQHSDIAQEVRGIKKRIRRVGGKPSPGWTLRISDRGASLVVEYTSAKGFLECWNMAL